MESRQAQNLSIRAAMRAPLLTREEEQELAGRWRQHNDQQAMNKIVIAHMRLVISMASRFRSYGLPLQDVIQEGHIGLLEAVSRFEPERQIRFSTYAQWWIRASMQDYVLRNWSIVRGATSSAQKALFFNLRRLRARIAAGKSQVPEHVMLKDISSQLGVSEKDVALMNHRLGGPDESLHAPISGEDENGASRMDFLVDGAPLPESVVAELVDGERRQSWVNSSLAVLNPRELFIIQQRRLMDDVSTLEHLGVKLGVSKERVRQIENRALEKIKTALIKSNASLAAEMNGH